MAAYRNRLHALMEVWKSCKRDNPKWRGIFKLAAAPKARGLEATPEGLNYNPTDCALQGAALMGAPSLKSMANQPYSAQPHHVQVFNEVARRAVEAAGFEVFDTFAATLHADERWFDEPPAREQASIHASEALSDMVTQMLLNQLCA